ncbi:MAG: beta-ketoacyl-[acyl-carrier-protein] synthase family protein [Gammaproteobacteria bacterium]
MPVFLNALGVVNALGCGTAAVRAALADPPAEALGERRDLLSGHSVHVGEVRTELPPIPSSLRRYASRNNRLLLAAFSEIEAAVNAARERYGPGRIAVVLGTGTSGANEGVAAIKSLRKKGAFPPEYDYVQQEIASPSEFLTRYLDLAGPAWTISTACTSGAKALASARRLIRAGFADAAITGDADTLATLTVRGFGALESLSAGVANPFSANRDGINIGEGAALFLMTRETGPVELAGAGESSDAHHISAPDPTGRGAETAMRAALADAGMEPAAVDYLNLHGTGTVQNDLMESHAVARVFGTRIATSSTKPLTGHTLGAAGATEAAFCWLGLTGKDPDDAPLPVHRWDGERDPALAPLRFVEPGEQGRCRVAMSSSFAFGGSNAVLVLRRHDG